MEQVAHQAIVMKFILDLAQALKVDPRGCFRRFFSKIKVAAAAPSKRHDGDALVYRSPPQSADEPYRDAFDRELERLKERVRGCARVRMESAEAELEEEEEGRQRRLGPGALDPAEVYRSLPKVRSAFVEANGSVSSLQTLNQSTLTGTESALVFATAFDSPSVRLDGLSRRCIYLTGNAEMLRCEERRDAAGGHEQAAPRGECVCFQVIITGLAQNGPYLCVCVCVQEAKYHLRRCIESGLWVPESGGEEETDGEEDY